MKRQTIGSLVKKAFRIRTGRTATPPKAIEDILAPIDPDFRSPLLSMYRGEAQLGTDGQPHPIDKETRISPSVGMWIYNLCMSLKPEATLEIGMAYGFSTLYFLAAVARSQLGHHTAIDPFQRSQWHGIGLAHAQALVPIAGSDCPFRLIEDRSDRAATDLARANRMFHVILIDGNHRFDDVLVDFYLYAALCAIGGYIVFDDMWMSSIQTVVAFVRANRKDFIEIPTAERNISVFQKIGDDSRKWTDFHEFAVSPGSR
jgi:predicted O-methyltransferase YrrM